MSIERIESTERMSRIVKHQGTVHLCGQTAANEEWDIKEQTQRCLEKVDSLLNRANSSRDQILFVTVYIRDMKDFTAMNEIWDAWFHMREKPARACVQAHMARDIILVEMTVTAAYL